MSYIAIDIGSGLCKFTNKSQKYIFPSLVGKCNTDDSFKLGLEDHQIIQLNNLFWMTGKAAEGYLGSNELQTSTKNTWAETQGYLILLYSAIAKLYPNGYKGKLSIVTGLPIKTYVSNVKEFKSKLIKTHKFNTIKNKYEIEFTEEKTIVIPQVIGLHFSNMIKHPKENWNNMKIGYIDPGTHTIGWACMEDGVFMNILSSGDNTGLSKLAPEIKKYLFDKFNWIPKNNIQILKAFLKGYIELYENGKIIKIDLIDVAQQYIPKIYKPTITKILDDWSNAKDMRVIVSSGGGKYLINTIQKHIPHAIMLNKETKPTKTNKAIKTIDIHEDVFDVMEGYAIYAESKLTE